ncbi:MAG: NYN domain-containing protein [Bacillota bacterium]|nr:NYN domain-containing protein [Bacillota bacterium]
MPQNNTELRLAVLIDGDNAKAEDVQATMAEIAVYGKPTIKRVYGDLTDTTLKGWKPSLLENGIAPVQQYAYTKHKNATDITMVIDAMDILYGGNVEGFALVTSDSDFTRLAQRLRESGMKVIGIGNKNTPEAFRVSCEKFIYIETIRKSAGEEAAEDKAAAKPAAKTRARTAAAKTKAAAKSDAPPAEPPKDSAAQPKEVPGHIVELLVKSLKDIADEGGYALLSSVNDLTVKKRPDFDHRNYGYKNMSSLIKTIKRFEVDERPNPSHPNAKVIYIRDKKAK